MANKQKIEKTTDEVIDDVIDKDPSDQVEQVDQEDQEEQDNQASDESDNEDEVLASKGDWYIIQCYTGYEYKVKARIEGLFEQTHYKETIFRVLVPEEETVEIKNNKRMEKLVKLYPGYVFIQMMADERSWFEIRKIPGVAKFVGSKVAPTPVVENEILKVLRKVGDKTRKIDVDFTSGDVIKVISGPFRGYTGPISEIDVDKGKLKAMISIFGRETPVRLDFDQVENTVQ